MYDILVIGILVIMVLFIVYNFYTDYTDWTNTGNTFAEGFNNYGKGMDNVGNRGRQLLPLLDYGWKGFKKQTGNFKQVDSYRENDIYAINLQNEIYKCEKPCDGDWKKVPGSLKQISTATNDIWGVNKSNKIFKKQKDKGGNFGNWKEVGGELKQVSASGKGYVWGVNEKNQVFSCEKPCPPWAGDGPLTYNKSQPLYKRPTQTYKPLNQGTPTDANRKLKKGEGNCRIKLPQTYKVKEKRIVPNKCKPGYTEEYTTYTYHPEQKKWIPAVTKYHPPTYRRECKKVWHFYTLHCEWRRSGWVWYPYCYWRNNYRNICYDVVASHGWHETIKNGYYVKTKDAWEEATTNTRWVDNKLSSADKAFCDNEYPGWKEASIKDDGWTYSYTGIENHRCNNYGYHNGRRCDARGNCYGKWVRTMTTASSPQDCANKLNEEGIFSYRTSDKSCIFVKKSRSGWRNTIAGLQTPCQLEGPYWGKGYKNYKTARGKTAIKNAVVYKAVDKPGYKPPLPPNFSSTPQQGKCSSKITIYDGDLTGTSTSYSKGNHWWVWGFNDRASSMVVPDGCNVTLYQHSNFRGASKTFGPGTYRSNEFSKLFPNNQMSSLKVTDGPITKSNTLSESDYKNYYSNKNWSPDAFCEDGLTCSKPNGGQQRVPGVYWGLDAKNQWSENANTGYCYDKNDTPYQRNGESKKGYFHGLPYNNDPNDTQQWNQEHRHYFWVSMNPDKLPPKKKKYSIKILNNDWSTVKKRVQRYCSNAKLVKKESGIYTFKCMGHENNILPDWKYHNVTLTQVSGGDKFIWGVNNNNNTIWRTAINGDGNWKQIEGKAKYINGAGKEFVYIVNPKNQVYRCRKPCDDNNWEKIKQDVRGTGQGIKATQISGTNIVVWAINNVNQIFKTVTELDLPFGQTKLGKCEGDCSSDNDCQPNLKCYTRKDSGDVPDGCKPGGPGDIPTHSYCYDAAWNYVPNRPDEKGLCVTEETCKKIAKELGLKLGTEERPFAGDYETKGLFSYKVGNYKGVAFYGRGGSIKDAEASLPPSGNKYRPELLLRGEMYETYYCSSGTGERLGKWNAKSKKDCIAQCKGKYPTRKGHKCFTDNFPPQSTWKAGADCPIGCKMPKCITGNCKDIIRDGTIYKSCTGTCSNLEGGDGTCKYDVDCSEDKCGAVFFNEGDTCDTTWQKKLSRMDFDKAVGKMSSKKIKGMVYNGPLVDNYKKDPLDKDDKTIFNESIMKQVLANKNLIPNDINIKIEKRGNYIRIGENVMNDVAHIRKVSLPNITDEDYETLGRIIVKIKQENGPPNYNLSSTLTNTVNTILTPSLKSKSTTGMFGDNSNSLMSDGKNPPYNSIWNLL